MTFNLGWLPDTGSGATVTRYVDAVTAVMEPVSADAVVTQLELVLMVTEDGVSAGQDDKSTVAQVSQKSTDAIVE